MKYVFADCCHFQQTTKDIVQHTAWCSQQSSTDTYEKNFDTEKELHDYLNERYLVRIHELLRE